MRDLTEKIVVTPTAGDAIGQGPSPAACDVELHGRLATLLAKAKSPDPAAAESRGIMVVAGEGLEPPTRGL